MNKVGYSYLNQIKTKTNSQKIYSIVFYCSQLKEWSRTKVKIRNRVQESIKILLIVWLRIFNSWDKILAMTKRISIKCTINTSKQSTVSNVLSNLIRSIRWSTKLFWMIWKEKGLTRLLKLWSRSYSIWRELLRSKINWFKIKEKNIKILFWSK